MPESTPSFFARLAVALGTFFRILSDPKFAQQLAHGGPADAPRLPEGPKAAVPEEVAKPPSRDLGPAMQLLSILQREGRLVDFLRQDIVGFDDADVGAAARVVHQGCSRVLENTVKLEAIRAEAEGSHLTLEVGFDPKRHRLVGNVQGQPPYRGILRHRGWRVIDVNLEEPLASADLTVVAPAEVEL